MFRRICIFRVCYNCVTILVTIVLQLCYNSVLGVLLQFLISMKSDDFAIFYQNVEKSVFFVNLYIFQTVSSTAESIALCAIPASQGPSFR